MSKKFEKQIVKNIRYNTEEAVQFILAPDSESELSELEDDDDTETDENLHLAPRVSTDLSEEETEYHSDQSEDSVPPQNTEESFQSASSGSKRKLNTKVSKTVEDIPSDEENVSDPPQLRRSKRWKTIVQPNYIETESMSSNSETVEHDTELDSESDSESDLSPPSNQPKRQNQTLRRKTTHGDGEQVHHPKLTQLSKVMLSANHLKTLMK